MSSYYSDPSGTIYSHWTSQSGRLEAQALTPRGVEF